MKTIQIELPEDLEKQLNAIGENQQAFILNAVREKIGRKDKLREELKEGYQATYQEDLDITKDFEPTDLEDWK